MPSIQFSQIPVTLATIAALWIASAVCTQAWGLAHLALTPGNTVLGDHLVWNAFTFAFVEVDIIRLALATLIIFVLGNSVEAGTNGADKRLSTAIVVGIAVSGVVVSFSSVFLYLPSGDEKYLYRPVYGSGPLQAVVAVAAHQIHGQASIAPGQAPWLLFSYAPLFVIITSAISQYLVFSARDFTATCLALLASWTYLRFLHNYGGGAVGDKRDDFEFLTFLPSPVRTPLRPIIKLLSAIFLSLPLFRGATGDGLKNLTAAGTSANANRAVASSAGAAFIRPSVDPVAERRREKALASLDKKLSDMRNSARPASAQLSVAGATSPAGTSVSRTPSSEANTDGNAANGEKSANENTAV